MNKLFIISCSRGYYNKIQSLLLKLYCMTFKSFVPVLSKHWNFRLVDILPLVENDYKFNKNEYYKISNFYLSSISYLTYCVTINVIKAW